VTARRLIFVISSLGGGGAERVISLMANDFAARGREVTLVTLAGKNEASAYPLHPAVKRGYLNALGKSRNALADNFDRIRKLRRIFRESRSDAIISFMESTNILTLLAAMGLGRRVLISDRIDPSSYSYGRIWRLLRNLVYPLADKVVVQTKAAVTHYPRYLAGRMVVIANPLQPRAGSHEKKASGAVFICGMGRLTRQKGFDVLLRALQRVVKKHPSVHLKIWGEGEERESLKILRDSLGLTDYVEFPGFTDDAAGALEEADIFVLSSYFEGFPNVLLEAMQAGAAVISTDCPNGPAEIITPGEDGLQVPPGDAHALAEALEKLIHNEAERCRLAANARKSVSRFYMGNIMAQWETLLADQIGRNR
jgi:glycosyltransferase involved in cell wall biosynthesis